MNAECKPKEITEEIHEAWERLTKAANVLDYKMPNECQALAGEAAVFVWEAKEKLAKELGYDGFDEFREAIWQFKTRAFEITSPLEAKGCPAGNPNCDVELYSAGDFVFCPECGKSNPNFSSRTQPESRSSPISRSATKQQPTTDTKQKY